MTLTNLSWATRRRAIVILVLALIGVLIIGSTYRLAFYSAPTCFDGVQNQGEVGIDCGGNVCTYLCSIQVQEPTVRFVLPLRNGNGRTDIIAYLDNPNQTAAARDASYTVQLYGKNNALLAQKTGTVNLPPHSTIPVFIPNFYNGSQQPANAFLIFKDSSLHWFRSATPSQTLPVSNIQVVNTTTPRVVATIENPTATTKYNVKVIIVVLGSSGQSNNVIAASQTIIPSIFPQSKIPVTFTWNTPFSGTPVREEILPIVPFSGP